MNNNYAYKIITKLNKNKLRSIKQKTFDKYKHCWTEDQYIKISKFIEKKTHKKHRKSWFEKNINILCDDDIEYMFNKKLYPFLKEQYVSTIYKKPLGNIYNCDMRYKNWYRMVESKLNETDGIILFYKWRLFIGTNSSIELYYSWCLQHGVKFIPHEPDIKEFVSLIPLIVKNKEIYNPFIKMNERDIYRIVFKAKKTIENYFCEIYYNPKYLFCRNRLIKEFELM